jgi:hypothetical protein
VGFLLVANPQAYQVMHITDEPSMTCEPNLPQVRQEGCDAFMDAILSDILKTCGGTALKAVIEQGLAGLLKSRQGSVSKKEEKAIRDGAREVVLQLATISDVHRYDPKVLAIEGKTLAQRLSATVTHSHRKSASRLYRACKLASARPARKSTARGRTVTRKKR